MATETMRPRAVMYIMATALVLTLVAVAWVETGSISRSSYLEFAARTRELEASIATGAMAESFVVTISQSNIIAAFSFPEYFQGKRSDDSMRQLLEAQRIRISGMLVDAYLDPEGKARFVSEGADSHTARAALVATAPTAWAWLSSHKGTYVEAGDGEEAFFLYYHPVMRDGMIVGLLACGIDLNPAIQRYIAPLENRAGRWAYLLGKNRRILWSSKPEARGSIFDDATWRGKAISEESFELGNYTFHVIIVDDDASLRAALLPAERLRDIVFVSGVVALAVTVGLAVKLYFAESRRRMHLEAEKRLTEAVAAREKELAESELRFQALFEGASDAIVIMNAMGSILRCNPRAVDIARLSRGRARRQNAPRPIASPSGRKALCRGPRGAHATSA